jgi:hypothetical protein
MQFHICVDPTMPGNTLAVMPLTSLNIAAESCRCCRILQDTLSREALDVVFPLLSETLLLERLYLVLHEQ